MQIQNGNKRNETLHQKIYNIPQETMQGTGKEVKHGSTYRNRKYLKKKKKEAKT